MQPRLTRSRTDIMIAGVCGGLAEYFSIDPTIVRLIFVLVSLTSGIGLLIYPVLWIVMPKASAAAGPQQFSYGADDLRRRAQEFSQEAAEVGRSVGREVREVLRGQRGSQMHGRAAAPPAEPYSFDPYTGEPVSPDAPSTGSTVNLGGAYPEHPIAPAGAAGQPSTRRRRMNWAGFVLVGVGLMVLADYFQFPTDFAFPLIMIVAGLIILVRR